MTTTMRKKVLEMMMGDICKRFGLEDVRTIKFCRLAENSNNYKLIRLAYKKLLNI